MTPHGAVRRGATSATAALLILAVAACGSESPGAPGAPSAAVTLGSTTVAPISSPSDPTSSAVTGSSGAPTPSGLSPAISAPTVPPGAAPPPAGAPVGPGSGSGGGRTELSGTVEAGVESGCVVLTDAGGAVLANLFGLDTAGTPLGSEVVVTGEFRRELMTTCQQGAPFEVSSVRPR